MCTGILPENRAVMWVLAAAAIAAGGALMASRIRLNRHSVAVVAEHNAVSTVATLVAENGDIQRVVDAIADHAARVGGAERAMVLRHLPRDGAEVVGVSAAALALRSVSVGLDPEGVVVAARDARHARAQAGRIQVTIGDDRRMCGAAGHALAVPVHVAGEPWGVVLCLFTSPSPPPGSTLWMLEQLAMLCGMAITNAGHRRTLELRAATDPLTGLTNHPTFRQMLDAEVGRARRHDRDLSLVMLDIDHFSEINALLGHRGGDQFIAEIAELIRRVARAEDVVARIGGQEFAWLMPDCSSFSAWAAAERLRGAVARGPLAGLEGRTISAGICDVAHSEGTGARMFELASGALYWAKQNGRDMCVRYSPDVVVDLSATERAARLEQSRALDAVRLLAQAVDARDPNTQRHSERVADVSAALAAEIGWTPERVRQLHDAGLVHDVGKIGIPDSVLLKEGPLSDEERARIETHAALGAQMVADVLSDEQVAWVRGHHERWDGAGYPDGLIATAIPDGARLMATADAFDAMVSDRPYRPGMAIDVACRIIRENAGSQFCPHAVEAFQAVVARGEIAAIYAPRTTAPDAPTSEAAGEH